MRRKARNPVICYQIRDSIPMETLWWYSAKITGCKERVCVYYGASVVYDSL